MGWTVYSESKTESEALAEMRRLHQWESEEARFEVLADGITGGGNERGYYAAVRRTDKATGEANTSAAVCLITLRPFGRKEMSEGMGPGIDNCPLYVLRALDPLPPVSLEPCTMCNATGRLHRPRWNVPEEGEDCFICKGAGEVDRNHSARDWRKRAWARHGGEPQGTQMELFA